MKPFRDYRIALTLASSIALTACATSSHVLIGTARPAIAPEEVNVLPQVPEQFEEIAEIEASSGASLRSAQDKLDVAIEGLQKEAARVGANAILLDDDDPGAPTVSGAVRKTSTMSDGSRLDAGSGSSARLSEFVRGLAIYVPADGGTFVIPVIVNGTTTLDFALDSGAAEVTIPADVFETLRRTGTISDADLLAPGEHRLADGSPAGEQTRFRIRTLRVGDTELRDVVASVSPGKGYLVLGRSFLLRVSTLTWSVDSQRHVLVLNGNIASAARSAPDDVNGAAAGIPDMSGQVTELMRPRGAAQTTTQAPSGVSPRAPSR
jgi:predicted aspartyl protease